MRSNLTGDVSTKDGLPNKDFAKELEKLMKKFHFHILNLKKNIINTWGKKILLILIEI